MTSVPVQSELMLLRGRLLTRRGKVTSVAFCPTLTPYWTGSWSIIDHVFLWKGVGSHPDRNSSAQERSRKGNRQKSQRRAAHRAAVQTMQSWVISPGLMPLHGPMRSSASHQMTKMAATN
ncbi:hypothetical protein CHARACLAT_000210 [Characodon lateralis]|uniref:Uncharacterized protein n=1 Tax=Characodon lateralis TaxID=208331 RepID=A0ABU7DWN3_9TELE|nr:hypothetical protein [Characodon lateralis]